MESDYIGYGWIGMITAIIAAKWAMELGFRQTGQLLWGIAAFLVPPVALLALYVRLIRQSAKEGKPAAAW
jgi:hypothetical protein